MKVLAGRADIDDVDRFVSWLGDVGAANDCAVQAFDARYVADRGHLEAAVERASRAFDRGENVARDRGVEILLYAAGRRQIDQAIEMGVSPGADVPVVVVVAPDASVVAVERRTAEEQDAIDALQERVTPEEGVLGTARDEDRIRDFFDITEAELAVAATDLSGLVRERVALLDVEK